MNLFRAISRLATDGVSFGLAAAAMFLCVAATADAGDLQIYTEDSPPANFIRDGELAGLGVDMTREMQRRVGDDAPIVAAPWARGYRKALNEPNVALFSTTRTEQREDLFHWVGPLLRVKWAFFAANDSDVKIQSLEDAKRVRAIGTYANDAREQFLLSQGFDNLDSAHDNVANVKKLLRSRVDLIISTNVGVRDTAWDAGVSFSALREVHVIKKADLYLAFSKGTDPAIVKAWRRAFEDMVRDGTYHAIYEKWLPGETPPLPALAEHPATRRE